MDHWRRMRAAGELAEARAVLEKLLIFTLLSAILMLILNHFLRSHRPSPEQLAYRQVITPLKSHEGIIIGTSHLVYALNPMALISIVRAQ